MKSKHISVTLLLAMGLAVCLSSAGARGPRSRSVSAIVSVCRIEGVIDDTVEANVGSLGSQWITVRRARASARVLSDSISVEIAWPVAFTGQAADDQLAVRSIARHEGPVQVDENAPLFAGPSSPGGPVDVETARGLLRFPLPCESLAFRERFVVPRPDRSGTRFVRNGTEPIVIFGPASRGPIAAVLQDDFFAEPLASGPEVPSGMVRLRFTEPGVSIDGWVTARSVRAEPAGPVEGTYGMGLYNRTNEGMPAPRRVRVDSGTPIFATPTDREPWAHTATPLETTVFDRNVGGRFALQALDLDPQARDEWSNSSPGGSHAEIPTTLEWIETESTLPNGRTPIFWIDERALHFEAAPAAGP